LSLATTFKGGIVNTLTDSKYNLSEDKQSFVTGTYDKYTATLVCIDVEGVATIAA